MIKKVIVVHNKYTNDLYPFTLDKHGCIVIIGNREYNIDNLIVSLINLEITDELDPNYFVVFEGKNDQ